MHNVEAEDEQMGVRMQAVSVVSYQADGEVIARGDVLAVEEPLEIRLRFCRSGVWLERDIAITMRTPGDDEDLVRGFLWSEGIVQKPQDVQCIRQPKPKEAPNTFEATLGMKAQVDLKRMERHFFVNSSCGVCGKSSIKALSLCRAPVLAHDLYITPCVLLGLHDSLRQAQRVFDKTGGLHAAALFDAQGTLLVLREDIGRHNAVDKVIGAQLINDASCMQGSVLCVSGRVGFEIVQKALMAHISVLVSVGAPSSLACALAMEFGQTLVGFLRHGRFNVYSGDTRIRF